jgi:surface protein
MAVIFIHAVAFNQDIGSWDVSNVTNMVGTLYYAAASNKILDAVMYQT